MFEKKRKKCADPLHRKSGVKSVPVLACIAVLSKMAFTHYLWLFTLEMLLARFKIPSKHVIHTRFQGVYTLPQK